MPLIDINIRIPKMILVALIAYVVATTIHFAHNGFYLEEYPNMPDWISSAGVYVALIAVHAVGLLGCTMLYFRLYLAGYLLLAAYAALGFDGLAHYGIAEFTSHTPTMNLTILFEVVTAFALFLLVAVHLLRISILQSEMPEDSGG